MGVGLTETRLKRKVKLNEEEWPNTWENWREKRETLQLKGKSWEKKFQTPLSKANIIFLLYEFR